MKLNLNQPITKTKTISMIRFHRASQIVGICRNGERMKCSKEEMNDVGLLLDASMVIDESGLIKAVDTEENLSQQDWYRNASFTHDIPMSGKCLIPGFVDGHTHPCWAGDRVHEFELKLAGVP